MPTSYNPRGDDGLYDYTGLIGELFPASTPAEWPMYSYSRPGSILWDAIAGGLADLGWTDDHAGRFWPAHHFDKLHGRESIRKFLAEKIEENVPESSLDKVFEAAGYTPAYVASRQLFERCFGKPYVAPPAKPTPVAAVPKPCTLPVVTKGA